MIHSYFKDKISAYKDLGLNLEETQLIQEHLSDCAECQELLERLKSLDSLVERESSLDSGEYWEKLAQKIDTRIAGNSAKVTDISKSTRSSGLMWKLMATAASLAFLVFIGIYQDDILSPSVIEIETPEMKQPSSTPETAVELRSAETDDATFSGDVDSRSRANETEKQEISGTRDETATLDKIDREVSVSKPVLIPKSTSPELPSEESPTILGESESEPLSVSDSKDDKNYKLSATKAQTDGLEVKNETVYSFQSSAATDRADDLLEQFSKLGVVAPDSALSDWRKERDDILLSLPQYRLVFDDKQSSKRTRAKSSVSSDAFLYEEDGTKEKNLAENERRLLELLINIMAATEDKVEADSALAIIQFMATRGGSEIREAANAVIDNMESGLEEESKSDN